MGCLVSMETDDENQFSHHAASGDTATPAGVSHFPPITKLQNDTIRPQMNTIQVAPVNPKPAAADTTTTTTNETTKQQPEVAAPPTTSAAGEGGSGATQQEPSRSKRLSMRSSQSRSSKMPKHFTFKSAILEQQKQSSATTTQPSPGSPSPPQDESPPRNEEGEEQELSKSKSKSRVISGKVMSKTRQSSEGDSGQEVTRPSVTRTTSGTNSFSLRVNFVYGSALKSFTVDGCDEMMSSFELRELCIQGHRRLRLTQEEGSACQSRLWKGRIVLVHNGKNLIDSVPIISYGLTAQTAKQEQVTLIFTKN